MQNILGDVFASAAIALDKPFVVGDFIVVDGLRGTVENVGLKTTRVRRLDGELLVFSNADLLKSRVRNFKRMHERRIQFALSVTYGTPADKVRRIPGWLRQAVLEKGVEFAFPTRTLFVRSVSGETRPSWPSRKELKTSSAVKAR